jgi:hypothetical protein
MIFCGPICRHNCPLIIPIASFHPETVFFRPGGVNLLGLLVRRTDVRLRATPWFPGQDEKILVSELKTNSFSSGVSGWKLANLREVF